jgi:hypothetical protein
MRNHDRTTEKSDPRMSHGGERTRRERESGTTFPMLSPGIAHTDDQFPGEAVCGASGDDADDGWDRAHKLTKEEESRLASHISSHLSRAFAFVPHLSTSS